MILRFGISEKIYYIIWVCCVGLIRVNNFIFISSICRIKKLNYISISLFKDICNINDKLCE